VSFRHKRVGNYNKSGELIARNTFPKDFFSDKDIWRNGANFQIKFLFLTAVSPIPFNIS